MPGINDAPAQVEPILELAAAAEATGVDGVALHLRGEVRGVFMDWLRSQRPDLVPRYEALYARGTYAPPVERERLAGVLRAARARHGPPVAPLDRGRFGVDRRPAPPAGRPVQPSLF